MSNLKAALMSFLIATPTAAVALALTLNGSPQSSQATTPASPGSASAADAPVAGGPADSNSPTQFMLPRFGCASGSGSGCGCRGGCSPK